MKLGTEKIGRARIDIEVDGSGMFHGEFNDATFTAKTRQDLIEQLRRAVKKADGQGVVAVTVLGIVPTDQTERLYNNEPFILGDGAVDAKLRAKHEREYDTYLLVTDDGAKRRFHVRGRRTGQIVRRLTLAETLQYTQLTATLRQAEADLETFMQEVRIDPDAALAAARTPT